MTIMNIPHPISDRIQVISEPEFAQTIAPIAHTYAGDKPLLIVLAERKMTSNELRQNCNGVDEAHTHAMEKPEQNVLLVSFFTPQQLKKQKPETALFLQLENAFFAQIPLGKKIALTKNTDGHDQSIAANALVRMVSTLNHTTQKYLDSTEESIADTLAIRLIEVKRVQTYFPELQNLSAKAFITELKKLNDRLLVTEVMPGKEIPGVYCDIEGTLLVDGIPQESVLAMLQEYESQGVPVTIWTLGNVAELGTVIQQAGIHYPVRSKMDYTGAIAEIVIDNDSEETFRARTKITPKTFIRV